MFNEDIDALRRDLDKVINMIYPVGAVYISTIDINPAELFGGTWEKIEDKFLLSSGSTHAAGSTGGEESHTLISAEMPVHKHDVAVLSSGQATTPSGGAGTTTSAGDHNHEVIAQQVGAGGTARRVPGGDGTSNSGTSTDGAHTHPTPAHTHTVPNHVHTVSEANKGSGAAHNNMPPYLAVYVWERTA